MRFIAFNLEDFHVQQRDATTRVGVRFIEARNMEKAKELLRTCHPGAWAIVPKKTFDQGIVHAVQHETEGGRR